MQEYNDRKAISFPFIPYSNCFFTSIQVIKATRVDIANTIVETRRVGQIDDK